jgi:uncharacterized membrane protein YbhN (UPF0104 family)
MHSPEAFAGAEAGAPPRPGAGRMARRSIGAAVAAAVLALAGWLLWRQLQGLRPADLASAARAIAPARIAASLAPTILSFACLAHYEAWATAWATPGRIPRREAWRTGLLAHAVSNTLGFHLFTAGAIRWRAYRARGLALPDVARIVALVGACVAAGVLALLALSLVALQADGGPHGRVLAGAFAALLLSLLFLRWRAARARAADDGDDVDGLAWRHGLRLAAVGAIEMAGAAGALYVLLPDGTIAPALFVLAFLGATLAGLASHAPGGLGVFEAAMLAALGAPAAPVLAALLAYRIVYNLLPFALALLALGPLALRPRAAQFDVG